MSRLITIISILALSLPWLAQGAPRPEAVDIRQASASSYWLASIGRQGTVAYTGDGNSNIPVSSDYKVFRNVKDYNAVGDGITDDFEAINRTMFDGGRCGQNCNSTTVTPAMIYFPPGVYRISKPIVMPYYTQVFGDVINPPTIKGLPNFEGIALLDSNPYIPGASKPDGSGINWYTNQNNFFRQIRNLILDLTDMPEVNPDKISGPAGLHWQVAQATTLQNVVFNMKPKGGNNKQQGIYMENGSGGFMADLVFNGGAIGMAVSNQQFTTRNITFNSCSTAVLIGWDWLWTFKSLSITDADVAIDMAALQNGVNQTVGSVILLDSKIQNSRVGIKTARNATSVPDTANTLTIQNVDFTGTESAVIDVVGNVLLPGGSLTDMWIQGDAYVPATGGSPSVQKRVPQIDPDCNTTHTVPTSTVVPIPGSVFDTAPGTVTHSSVDVAPTLDTSANGAPSTSSDVVPTSANGAPNEPIPTNAPASTATTGISTSPNTVSTALPTGDSIGTCTRQAIPAQATTLQKAWNKPKMAASLLDSTGKIFERSKPTYQNVPASSFISVKARGAIGDGITDDSAIIQQILDSATPDQIVYFDHGAYLIKKTIQVPKNIRISGEVWPLIMVDGPSFQNTANPQPAWRVANPGDTGVVEITDLMFETRGPAPGVIMMEWNIADPEGQQGASGMWDVHFRVGGSAGTELQTSACRGSTPDSKQFNPNCAGSFMMMHVTQQSTGYFENCWFWVADHELDQYGEGKLNIFNGRGVLIESQGPVWMYGTSSEHHVLYNYQVSNAKDVFMGFIQTETAYMQSAPNALTSGFEPNAAYSDPDFSTCTTDKCKKTWGLRIVDSENVYVMGGGLYSFFEDYTQTCIVSGDCQENMIDIECSTEVYLMGITTVATVHMVTVNGQPAAKAVDHRNQFGQTLALFHQA